MKKRGLSPVIATVLLISLGLVLAVTIFIWARSFIGENIEKQGSAIELLCDEVVFRAEAYSGNLYVENLATVPIYGFEIRKKEFLGEILKSDTVGNGGITAGQTGSFALGGVASGDEIIVIPILLGKADSSATTHVCEEDYGIEVVVGS